VKQRFCFSCVSIAGIYQNHYSTGSRHIVQLPDPIMKYGREDVAAQQKVQRLGHGLLNGLEPE
jgi:hypothetical protein